MERSKERSLNLRTELIKEIDEAKGKALHEDELEPIKDEQDKVTRSFLAREIGAAEYNKKIKELDVQTGVVKRKGIVEYSELLRGIGMSEDEVKETLAHENEHMTESLRLGVDPVYQIQFVRTKTKGLGVYPSVNFDFPDSMPEEEQRVILSQIIQAPEDLSIRDTSQLGQE